MKKDFFKDLVDMKHRMKLTPTEVNFISFEFYVSKTPPTAPPAPYDVESMINKQLAKVSSFNNSIQNISLMMKNYALEEKKYEKKYTKYKLINIKIYSTDVLVIKGTTSASVTLSITGVGIIVVPITAGVGYAMVFLLKFVNLIEEKGAKL